jgi:hypothetical protein
MWKVGNVSSINSGRTGWRPCHGKPHFFAPRHVQKSTHSIPFETGQDLHYGSPLKHFGSRCFLGYLSGLIGSSSAVALANKAGAQLPLSTNDVRIKTRLPS